MNEEWMDEWIEVKNKAVFNREDKNSSGGAGFFGFKCRCHIQEWCRFLQTFFETSRKRVKER